MKRICVLFFMLLQLSVFSSGVLNITDFGATAGTGTLQTQYIQAAIDSAERAGGDTVLIPQGVFLSSTLFLKDNVILKIAKNGVLKGALKTSLYPDVIPSVRSFADHYPQRSLIYAEGKHNIGFSGEGTLDGNGLSLDFVLNSGDKPLGVRFISCTNVLYEGITMKNSGFWMMHNLNCDTLTIRNLKIINHNFGNGDGIDIDGCKNVLVENCTVDSNDDPFVIKTTNTGEASGIEVRNCTFQTYSRAIKIGTETYGPVKNVYIHDCQVKFSTNGPFGDHYPGDCGIQLSIVDGGSLENVTVENIQVKGVQTPIFIRLGDRNVPFQDNGPQPPMGSLQNVILRHITAEGTGNISSSITGIPGFPVKGITLEDIQLTVPGGQDSIASYTVPENESGKPGFDMFGDYLPAYGLYIRHADSINLDQVCITAKQQDERPEMYFEDTSEVSISPCVITAVQNLRSEFFKVYPNPVTEKLQIFCKTYAAVEYRVCDMMGKEIAKGILTDVFSAVDVSNLPAGIYFIRLYKNQVQLAALPFLKSTS